jgi:undecaprenyl diphosphate synthase
VAWDVGVAAVAFCRTLGLVATWSKAGFEVVENEAAGIGTTPGLRESYELCRREGWHLLGPVWALVDLLAAEVRPHVEALGAFAKWTDEIADEGESDDRGRVLAQWCADTLAEVRAGRSEHPLRQAFVHTMCLRALDIAVLEEHLDTVQTDSARPPAFATFADQRRYLRGIAGTVAELATPLLEPRESCREAVRLMSLLGEVCQLVDIFRDFPSDLAAGRCYLPGEDLERLGLSVADLRSGERRDQADELIAIQLGHARDLLEQATPVVGMVSQPAQPFLHAHVVGAALLFDEVEHFGAQVLVEGVQPPPLPASLHEEAAGGVSASSATRATLISRRPRWGQSPRVPGVIPAHVAVIMDGNRRWATDRGLSVEEGYRAGEGAIARLVASASRFGISHLSLFAFSTENWNRSQEELACLFDTMSNGIARWGAEWLQECGVRVRWCGRRDRLDQSLAAALTVIESMTWNNRELTLTIFADYGGHTEMVTAARALAAEAVAGTIRPEQIGPEDIVRNLSAPDLPEVDLLIRTSGEQRISNFLPWHLAYAELVFEPACWPDFGYSHLLAALNEYAGRQRRFGSDRDDPGRVDTAGILDRRPDRDSTVMSDHGPTDADPAGAG